MILTGFLILTAAVLAAAFFSWQAYKASQAGRSSEQSLQLLQQQLESIRSQLTDGLTGQTGLVNQQIHQLTSQVQQRLDSVSRQLTESQQSVGERLDNAARVVGDVQKALGALGQASERIFEVGKDIAGLQEILRSPKLRGGLGEFFLADLLGQILPAKHFSLQHGFKTGDTVDAVIRLGGRLVPVDSKFPLENFRKMLDTKTDDERRAARKKLVADVKKHVDAIASKYILPDEDTYDFALMYVPAENVYYEVVVKDETGEGEKSLTEYALGRRVIPVSPNSFYAYLQVILLGLKGFQIEENARAILQSLSRLQGDVARFREDFSVLGKHLSSARGKYEDAEKRLDRFQEKLASSTGAEAAPDPLEAPLPKIRLPTPEKIS